MASIVQRNNRYNVVYLYDDEATGKRKQKWESFKTMAEANREDCSKIPKARKAHKFSTFGRSLSIRTFAGHRHEPPYLLLYLKMKIIHEIGQAAFSYN